MNKHEQLVLSCAKAYLDTNRDVLDQIKVDEIHTAIKIMEADSPAYIDEVEVNLEKAAYKAFVEKFNKPGLDAKYREAKINYFVDYFKTSEGSNTHEYWTHAILLKATLALDNLIWSEDGELMAHAINHNDVKLVVKDQEFPIDISYADISDTVHNMLMEVAEFIMDDLIG